MKLDIDASLLTADGEAIGRLHGPLDIPEIPRIGSHISLQTTDGSNDIPMRCGFSGRSRVTQVVHTSPGDTNRMVVLLDDIVANNRMDAMLLARYFEDAFGLFLEEYE